MSASLVGSEMCIRDSLSALFEPGMCRKAAVATAAGRAMLSIGRVSTRMSVSYTHLTLPTICSV
eukprot:640868-Alexandrium_andersonii.AAC.1